MKGSAWIDESYSRDPDEQAVWEEKVRFALYSERLRERADVERKAMREAAEPPAEENA